MLPLNTFPPVLCFVGKSNSGKTTLIEKLLLEFTRLGLAVGTIKHDVHGFDIDIPGKDSWRHKKAGARKTVISSPTKLSLIQDTDHDHSLDEIVQYFCGVDLIVAEGYSREAKPKVEVFRSEVNPSVLCRGDVHLIAVASNVPLKMGVPRFGLDEVTELASFIMEYFSLLPAKSSA